MKARMGLLLFVTLLFSCAKQEGCIQLSQDYRLWMVSSKEKYIATNDDVYYLGPIIYSIAVQDGIIFGENSKVESNNYKNVAGHFILAGSKGIYTGLSKSEFETIAKELGIIEFDLKNGPSELFGSERYPECG